MHAILLKNSDPLALIPPLRFPKIEQIAPRVLFWELVIISMLGLYIANSFFPLEDISYVQANTSEIKTGPAVDQLIKEFKNSNLNPVLLQKITRDSFSVEGRIIALNGDNMQVFEYPNKGDALKEASLVAKKYYKSSYSFRQGKEIYLYTKDTLAIFYMGNDKNIISALDKNARRSIVMFSTP